MTGAFLDDGRTPLPPPEVLREAFARGDLQVMGEIAAQYHGLDPSDEWFEPYLALAEEFDIPVGIHTGLAPPGAAYGCCPKFEIGLGNPLALEPMLKHHPKLRVWLMHAGWPFLAETKALLYMYPQVHADVSVINWSGAWVPSRPPVQEHVFQGCRLLARRTFLGKDGTPM